MNSAPKVKASTQKFVEIENIIDNIVLLKGGNACLVIKIEAINFALLSIKEQDAKIYAYISLLNSLSFPIQILIKNEKIDLSSYTRYLEQEAEKINRENNNFKDYIRSYKEFVQNLITVNTVLDKNFYIVIPYSYLESGVRGARNKSFKKEEFLNQAKTALNTKANSLLSQLQRLSLKAKILEKEALIKLFFKIYNESDFQNTADDIKAAFVTTR